MIAWGVLKCIMAHAASQLKKNRDLELNPDEENEKKRKHRKRSRDRKKKVPLFALAKILDMDSFVLLSCHCSEEMSEIWDACNLVARGDGDSGC